MVLPRAEVASPYACTGWCRSNDNTILLKPIRAYKNAYGYNDIWFNISQEYYKMTVRSANNIN